MTLFVMMLVGILLSVSGPAAAQDAEEVRQARQLFRDGKKHYKNEDFAAALEAFQKSFELSGRSELLFNIGLTYQSMEEWSPAIEFFQRYLEEVPKAKNGDQVVEWILELQERVAAEMASLSIQTRLDGRDVYLNGEIDERCSTPCTLTLSPGDYSLRVVDAETGTEQRREVSLTKSEMASIEIEVKVTEKPSFLLVDSSDSNLNITWMGRASRSIDAWNFLRARTTFGWNEMGKCWKRRFRSSPIRSWKSGCRASCMGARRPPAIGWGLQAGAWPDCPQER